MGIGYSVMDTPARRDVGPAMTAIMAKRADRVRGHCWRENVEGPTPSHNPLRVSLPTVPTVYGSFAQRVQVCAELFPLMLNHPCRCYERAGGGLERTAGGRVACCRSPQPGRCSRATSARLRDRAWASLFRLYLKHLTRPKTTTSALIAIIGSERPPPYAFWGPIRLPLSLGPLSE